jgi:hypothetical protein
MHTGRAKRGSLGEMIVFLRRDSMHMIFTCNLPSESTCT